MPSLNSTAKEKLHMPRKNSGENIASWIKLTPQTNSKSETKAAE